MFKVHPELPGIIVQWFVTTLIKTPGHAPAERLAAASILNQLQTPGGAAQVTQQLLEARRKDPPGAVVAGSCRGHYRRGLSARRRRQDRHRDLQAQSALAYPDSADAHSNLADAYLEDGQKELARQYAEKALALLDSHRSPASSWADTEQRRGEIRSDVEKILKQLTSGS